MRTTINDFAEALTKIDERLAKYEPVKQGVWRGQTIYDHIIHALDHLDEGRRGFIGYNDEIVAGALRALMALQLYLEKEKT